MHIHPGTPMHTKADCTPHQWDCRLLIERTDRTVLDNQLRWLGRRCILPFTSSRRKTRPGATFPSGSVTTLQQTQATDGLWQGSRARTINHRTRDAKPTRAQVIDRTEITVITGSALR